MKKKAPKGTLKKALSYVKTMPVSTALVVLFSVLHVACSLALPVLFGDAVDVIAGKGQVDFSALQKLLLYALCAFVGSALSLFAQTMLNQKIVFRVVEKVRKDAFARLVHLPLSYLDTHAHGELLSRLTSDADGFADGLLTGFTQLITGVLTIVGTIVIMFLSKWQIALVVVLITPLSLFLARFVATKTHRHFESMAKARARETAFLEERISSIKTVQAFAMEEKSEKEFCSLDDEYKTASLKATFFSSLTNPSTRFLNNVVYALVALLGSLSVLGGGFTVGGLTKFLSYATQYSKPFNEISGVLTELTGALVCASRVFEMEETPPETDDGRKENGLKKEKDVEFSHVNFSYDKKIPLIENFSLCVKEGERIAIVGRTGAGKTTILNLLMRYYPVDGGEIFVCGRESKEYSLSALRKNFGIVPQETWLKKGTVRENLKLGKKEATDEEMIECAKKAGAHSFIQKLPKGYDTVLGEDGGALSSGQKQLLCIARVMLCAPNMLVLDEATSSVDTRTEKKIGDAFETLMKGKTSFIVAHRLSTVENADRILVIEKGKIVEDGTHEELLLHHGAYETLYLGQFS